MSPPSRLIRPPASCSRCLSATRTIHIPLERVPFAWCRTQQISTYTRPITSTARLLERSSTRTRVSSPICSADRSSRRRDRRRASRLAASSTSRKHNWNSPVGNTNSGRQRERFCIGVREAHDVEYDGPPCGKSHNSLGLVCGDGAWPDGVRQQPHSCVPLRDDCEEQPWRHQRL